MPRTIVANCTPAFVLMCSLAHTPNAFEPPDLLSRATTTPSITRNTSIPTLYESASDPTIPSLITCVSVPSKFPAYSAPPITIPINSELYTSFVISASRIAATGGTIAHAVAYNAGSSAASSANANNGHAITNRAVSIIMRVTLLLKLLIFSSK